MDAAHSCRCCLRRAPDRDVTTPYTHLGTTEIYSDILAECFAIHLILNSEEKVGICDVCIGRLRDASDFKLQVQRSQEELQAWLQRAPHVKEENPAVESILKDADGPGEEPVLFEEPPVKIKSENEGGTNDEEGPDLLYEAPAGEPEVSDDEEEDCISLAFAGAGRADLEPARAVSARAREQLAMACSVRLERLRGDEAPHASQTCLTNMPVDRASPRVGRMERPPQAPDVNGRQARDVQERHTGEVEKNQTKGRPKTISPYPDLGLGPALRAGPRVGRMVRPPQAPDVNGRQARDVKGRQTGDVEKIQPKGRPKTISPHPDLGLGPTLPDDTAGLRSAEQAYICDTCGERYRFKCGIAMHVNKHAPKKTSRQKYVKGYKEICDICNKQLASGSLEAHKRLHTGEKPFACGFCDKRFAQLSTLNAHTPQHTGERRFSCDICNQRFTRMYTLRKHQKSKHQKSHKDEERPFKCEECDKKFKFMYYLQAHKRTHLKVKPYRCDICDKRFLRNWEFTLHLEAHAGKSRFTCQVCNKQFSYRNDLRKHEVIHTRIKPYACDVCHERFPYKKSLKRHSVLHQRAELNQHLRTHTAEQRYTCDICKNQFKLKKLLIRHIKSHI